MSRQNRVTDKLSVKTTSFNSMKTNKVTRIDGQPLMSVSPELESELPSLDINRLTYLTLGIKRDGVLDPIKYWVNPVTQSNEIIDGHHRHKIANELGKTYQVQEIAFPSGSITAVKYWMHVNQSGRRGSEINIPRMLALKQQLAKENDEYKTKTQIVKEIVGDAKISERKAWRDLSEKDDEKPARQPKKSLVDRIKTIGLELKDEDIDALIAWLLTLKK